VFLVHLILPVFLVKRDDEKNWMGGHPGQLEME